LTRNRAWQKRIQRSQFFALFVCLVFGRFRFPLALAIDFPKNAAARIPILEHLGHALGGKLPG
jgi:hypothetical protein